MKAMLRIYGPPITANSQATQIESIVSVNPEGKRSVELLCRTAGEGRSHDSLTFNEDEWQRLKQAIAEIDATMRPVRSESNSRATE
jgi:hypothetical protein